MSSLWRGSKSPTLLAGFRNPGYSSLQRHEFKTSSRYCAFQWLTNTFKMSSSTASANAVPNASSMSKSKPEIIDDKSPHCIPFILRQLSAFRSSPQHQGQPFFIGLNGVQGRPNSQINLFFFPIANPESPACFPLSSSNILLHPILNSKQPILTKPLQAPEKQLS
jgi:hypothetical protein